MHVPALFPALAILAGAALGTWLGGGSLVPGLLLLAAALVAAVFGLVTRRPRVVAAAAVAVFGCMACVLAQRAEADAADPPLRGWLLDAREAGPILLEGRLRDDAAAGPNGIALTVEIQRAAGGRPSGGRLARWSGGGPSAVRLNVSGTIGLERFNEWRGGRLVRVPASLRLPVRNQDPGVGDARLALARRGVALVGTVKSGALVEVVASGWWGAELAAAVRSLARQAIHRHVGRFDLRAEAIVIAILIGDRVGLDDEVQRQLQEAGTYHVIAISGGNIAILSGVLLSLMGSVGFGARSSSWVAIVVLVGYAALVGGGASVLRATVMAVIYLLARQADHRGSPLNALAVASGLLLLASPRSVVEVAFWLTFGATLGIMLGGSAVGGVLPARRWLRPAAALLLASCSAELALLPVTASGFSRVTFAGLALNFLAIPMMGLAQIAGILVVPLSAISGQAADLVGYAAFLGAAGLVKSAALVDFMPWLTWRLPAPAPWVIALYYAGWVAWFSTPIVVAARGWSAALCRRAKTLAAAVVGLAGAWILVEPVTLIAPGVSGRLRVTVLDVGHGDAVLVQLPDRRSLLVDAGGSMTGSSFDIGGRVVSPAAWALGTRRLDAFVLSHADPDHLGGAPAVVRDLRPLEIWEGIPVPPLLALQELERQARGAGARWLRRQAGDVVEWGDVRLRVHHPPPADWERQRVRNDDSLVIEVRYRDVSVVLPGDIGRDVERRLASSFEPAVLRVLKVPHHGSSTSSSSEFLDALRPRVAILSAGAATRVSPDTLERYEQRACAVFRTDRDGAVMLDTDGHEVVVTTFTGGRSVFAK